jgi:hypothetical protein
MKDKTIFGEIQNETPPFEFRVLKQKMRPQMRIPSLTKKKLFFQHTTNQHHRVPPLHVRPLHEMATVLKRVKRQRSTTGGKKNTKKTKFDSTLPEQSIVPIKKPIEGWKRNWYLSFCLHVMVQAAHARGLHPNDAYFEHTWQTLDMYRELHEKNVTWYSYFLGIKNDDELSKMSLLVANRIADHTEASSVEKSMVAYKKRYKTLNFR